MRPIELNNQINQHPPNHTEKNRRIQINQMINTQQMKHNIQPILQLLKHQTKRKITSPSKKSMKSTEN